ncbi:hypothetical protein TrVFT333_006024 [Trichoderma virens FT-333]|nr:hypothetical protein TrVFT333_006024 [Trichoderma virens FT-333]
MARGNQRELARAKNLKNAAKAKGGNGKSGSELAKQGLSDAEKMRQKQAAANERKAELENKALQEKRDAKAKKPTELGS